MSENNYVLGIDSCRSGWYCVFGYKENWSSIVLKHINDLWQVVTLEQITTCLIDIPIGLPYRNKRSCDSLARKKLGRKRSSSIFSVPSREAVYADSYLQACELNQNILGVKLSKQTWNICPSIIEVDQFITSHNGYEKIFLESHPELAFWALASGKAMEHYKKTEAGQLERLELLRKHIPEVEAIFEYARAQYARKDLAIDDILDGIVLAATAQYSAQLDALPREVVYDEKGLPMQIVYCSKFI